MPPPDTLRYVGAALTIVVGAIHLQQYLALLKDVPTIGELFLLNAAVAGAVAIVLMTRLARPAALGGIALSAGALVSILIAMTSTLFGYSEPDFRLAVGLAVAAEAAAVLALGTYLVKAGPGGPARGA